MPTANVNGIDIYYERGGSGPRLLMFNGSGGTLETIAPLLDRLRATFDVLAHDQRGLGRTAIPPDPYSMADYAADGRALLDHVGWDRCAVAGVSFGGMVAQEFAVTWPERVTRLALMCTSSGGKGQPSYPLHEMAKLPAKEQAALAATLLDTRFTPDWLNEHPRDKAILDMRSARRPAEPGSERRRGELAQLDARAEHDVWDRLPNITCPTLVAGGRYDGVAPPANSEAIASRIPDAKLRLYEGGHLFFLQDPAAFPDIVAFLAEGS